MVRMVPGGAIALEFLGIIYIIGPKVADYRVRTWVFGYIRDQGSCPQQASVARVELVWMRLSLLYKEQGLDLTNMLDIVRRAAVFLSTVPLQGAID